MKIIWKFTPEEIEALQHFVRSQSDNAFVRNRIENNLKNPPAAVTIETFWQRLVGSVLSSQQRSGPYSHVSRFLAERPFPLSYAFYSSREDKAAAGTEVMQAAGGIRFTTRNARFLAENHDYLAGGGWAETSAVLERLVDGESVQAEREAAAFIRNHFSGFGPKQSRNLLQGLGLTKYEIPIDSRITRWLNEFGFAVQLSAGVLSDPHYYNFVSDGVQALCERGGIYPCVFDAAVFSSYDDGWNEENIVW